LDICPVEQVNFACYTFGKGDENMKKYEDELLKLVKGSSERI